MKLTPRTTLLAGGALILLANAVALFGVHLNRSGEPEGRLRLSERELSLPWGWSRDEENSGLALILNWRMSRGSDSDYADGSFGHGGGTAEWLDEAHMKALGFDTVPATESHEGRRRFERQRRREVLLVLELAGPAWQQALQQARDNAARHEAAARANADSKEFAAKAKRAREQLKAEEEANSRLFAVDTGLDLATLRAKYPDRGRYTILKGMLQPRIDTRDGKTRFGGEFSALSVQRINVPHALRPALEPAWRDEARRAGGGGRRFEVTLAVGRRLEPWIEAATVSPRAPR